MHKYIEIVIVKYISNQSGISLIEISQGIIIFAHYFFFPQHQDPPYLFPCILLSLSAFSFINSFRTTVTLYCPLSFCPLMHNCYVGLSIFVVVPILKHLKQIAMWSLLLLTEEVTTDLVSLSSTHRNGKIVFSRVDAYSHF